MVTLAEDKPLCKIGDCSGKAYGHGWGKPHWQRWYRTGDPLLIRSLSGASNGKWKGDSVGYHGLHTRLEPERGKAQWR